MCIIYKHIYIREHICIKKKRSAFELILSSNLEGWASYNSPHVTKTTTLNFLSLSLVINVVSRKEEKNKKTSKFMLER